ncbi:hypothetical protein DPEC_G00165370 [Dallia pectoralis]|uniref:Uncharacterized protein n=1 Tax=Dallia pectoralis TaxID=75939 RepID=A0ACC2GHD2_DALPE|nr:hypothetical protein DPEC_G00165370 [Dallia pectoralis]
MRLAVLFMCWTLLAFTRSPRVHANPHEGAFQSGTGSTSCRVTVKPAGKCGGEGMDQDACPYQVIMPPLDIILPRQLWELEKTVNELQQLKKTVEQLKRACMECKIHQRETKKKLEDSERETENADKEMVLESGDRETEKEEVKPNTKQIYQPKLQELQQLEWQYPNSRNFYHCKIYAKNNQSKFQN